MTDLVQEYQNARQAKVARRAAKSSRYFTGTVSGVDGAGYASVVTPTAEIACVIPDGLVVAPGDSVRVRVQGCDYLITSVLGEDVVSTDAGSVSGSGDAGPGGYEKRANGRLTCWVRVRITPVPDANTSRTWTFPVPFTTIPTVTVTASTSATAVKGAFSLSESTTSTGIAVIRSNDTATWLNACAEGFWR